MSSRGAVRGGQRNGQIRCLKNLIVNNIQLISVRFVLLCLPKTITVCAIETKSFQMHEGFVGVDEVDKSGALKELEMQVIFLDVGASFVTCFVCQ